MVDGKFLSWHNLAAHVGISSEAMPCEAEDSHVAASSNDGSSKSQITNSAQLYLFADFNNDARGLQRP